MFARAWADSAPTLFLSAKASAKASSKAFRSSSFESEDFASDQATLEKALGPNSSSLERAVRHNALSAADSGWMPATAPAQQTILICWAVIFGTLRSRDAETADTSKSWAASQVAAAHSKLAHACGPNSANLSEALRVTLATSSSAFEPRRGVRAQDHARFARPWSVNSESPSSIAAAATESSTSSQRAALCSGFAKDQATFASDCAEKLREIHRSLTCCTRAVRRGSLSSLPARAYAQAKVLICFASNSCKRGAQLNAKASYNCGALKPALEKDHANDAECRGSKFFRSGGAALATAANRMGSLLRTVA